VPCFLWIFLGAPFIEKLRGNAVLASAMSAITAAVVGVILNLAIWFGLHFLFTEARIHRLGPLWVELPVWSSLALPSLILSIAAAIAIFRFRMSVIPTLLGCAAAGMAWTLLIEAI